MIYKYSIIEKKKKKTYDLKTKKDFNETLIKILLEHGNKKEYIRLYQLTESSYMITNK